MTAGTSKTESIIEFPVTLVTTVTSVKVGGAIMLCKIDFKIVYFNMPKKLE